MKNFLLSIFLTSSLFLGFCTTSKNHFSDQIIYGQKSEDFEKCVEDVCAKVVLSYPFFEGDPLLAKKLNGHIDSQLIYFINIGDHASSNSQSAIKDFFAAYIRTRRELAGPAQEWWLEITGKVTFQSEHLLGLRFFSYSFLGGAHPNVQELHVTFDLEKGGIQLSQQDIVLDEDKLLELAQKEFREFHQVSPSVNLEEDGRFFLDKGKFFLPRSMGYEQEEFVLLYNNYEIGSYAMGSTELRFPLKKLEGIILSK